MRPQYAHLNQTCLKSGFSTGALKWEDTNSNKQRIKLQTAAALSSETASLSSPDLAVVPTCGARDSSSKGQRRITAYGPSISPEMSLLSSLAWEWDTNVENVLLAERGLGGCGSGSIGSLI